MGVKTKTIDKRYKIKYLWADFNAFVPNRYLGLISSH